MSEGRAEQDQRVYAWNWFALHAGQRLQLVNFWLVAVAFLATAFVEARTNHLIPVALGVSITGAVASLAFNRLDNRTRQLVHLAENALLSIEARQTPDPRAPADATALMTRSRLAERSRLDSYRVIIQGLQLLVATLFLLGAIYCLVLL
jgi:hypothetical protein